MSEPVFEVMNLNNSQEYPYSCHVEETAENRLDISPHYHYEIELLFFLQGNARVSVGKESYHVGEGEMILINAMEVHSIDAPPKTRYSVIMFNPSVLPSSAGTCFESKYIAPFTMKSSTLKRCYTKEALADTIIPEHFQNIFEEYNKKHFGFEFAIRLGIYQIILWILRNCYSTIGFQGSILPSLKRDQAARFEKLYQYVEDHYNCDITSREITDICHIDYSYFARQFKFITGKTFRDYLNFVRIANAEQLLLTTNKSVTEIALLSGYSNTSYFIKQFKKYKDISPGQIRKMLSKEA